LNGFFACDAAYNPAVLAFRQGLQDWGIDIFFCCKSSKYPEQSAPELIPHPQLQRRNV